jgi:hypothetical protein
MCDAVLKEGFRPLRRRFAPGFRDAIGCDTRSTA